MPGPVIARRINWPYSEGPLKKRLALIRPEYLGIVNGPVHRVAYRPGEITQCDLWFPEMKIPVGHGQDRMLPVPVMVLGYSRFRSATMLPSRPGRGRQRRPTPHPRRSGRGCWRGPGPTWPSRVGPWGWSG